MGEKEIGIFFPQVNGIPQKEIRNGNPCCFFKSTTIVAGFVQLRNIEEERSSNPHIP